MMEIISVELAGSVLDNETSTVKFIMNQNAVAFFSASQQHRDIKVHGLSYEDDYQGNAVAGILTIDKVEIRFHSAYSDDRIRGIWSRVRAMPQFAKFTFGPLYYQGRALA